MIMEFLLCLQKSKTAETFDGNSFPADSSITTPSLSSQQFLLNQMYPSITISGRFKKNPKAIFNLFPRRFLKPMNLHAHVQAPHGSRGRCVWCRVIYQEKQSNNIVANYNNEVRKARKVCLFCTSKNNLCFLCNDHFVIFHSE